MALAIDNAREVMDLIFKSIKLAGGNVSTEQGTAIALAYASIAQAEQLKRIADSLEMLEQRPVLQMRNL